MIIKELQLKKYPYKSRKGLSEKVAKNYFEKKGYKVFRGTMILGKHFSINYELYDNVKKKYDILERILLRKLGLDIYFLRNLLIEIKGIPDYFIYRNKQDNFFAEIKLEHESVKLHQLECMKILEKFNFQCYLIRIKSKPYRIESEVNLQGEIKENFKLKNRFVKIRQKRLSI